MKKTVVAFDFGASSGRAIAGTYQDGRLEYKEVHRFDNIPVDDGGRMCHNFPAICKEVDAALSKMNSADGLSFDTWGVDYGLLNKSGNLLRLPCHYRDTRTAGTVEKVLKKIPADNLYRATGNQIMEINTLFQLTTEDTAGAEKLLFMPDLFAHHLCGSMQTEPTIASTSQLLDPVNQTWRTDIATACGIDPQLLPAVGPSAAVLGKTDGGIQVIATAGHDTQCAVAAMPAAAGEQPAFLSCGTWSLIGCELDEPILTPESRADDLSNEQGANGKTNYLKNISGLWLIQETRRAYRRAGAEYSYNDLEQLARAAAVHLLYRPGRPSLFHPRRSAGTDPRLLPGDRTAGTGKRRRCGTLHLRESGYEVPLCAGSDQRPHRAAIQCAAPAGRRHQRRLPLSNDGRQPGFPGDCRTDGGHGSGQYAAATDRTGPAAGCGSRSGADPQDRDLKNL